MWKIGSRRDGKRQKQRLCGFACLLLLAFFFWSPARLSADSPSVNPYLESSAPSSLPDYSQEEVELAALAQKYPEMKPTLSRLGEKLKLTSAWYKDQSTQLQSSLDKSRQDNSTLLTLLNDRTGTLPTLIALITGLPQEVKTSIASATLSNASEDRLTQDLQKSVTIQASRADKAEGAFYTAGGIALAELVYILLHAGGALK